MVSNTAAKRRFILEARSLFRRTLLIITGLAALNWVGYLLMYHTTLAGRGRFLVWFGLDREQSVPAFFSAVQLLLAALVSGMTASRKSGSEFRSWFILCITMAFFAFDEAIQIHEVGDKLKHLNHSEHPLLTLGWVVPGITAAILFGLVMVKFLLRLPRPIAAHLTIAGAAYVASAAGMEILGAAAINVWGRASVQYALCYTVEEVGEMLSIAWYIRTVFVYSGPYVIEALSEDQ